MRLPRTSRVIALHGRAPRSHSAHSERGAARTTRYVVSLTNLSYMLVSDANTSRRHTGGIMKAPRSLAVIGAVSAVAMVGGLRWQREPDWREQFREAALQIPFDADRSPVSDSALPAGKAPRGF